MLTGDYFPYHPKPQADELLSSWIARIARGHAITPSALCTNMILNLSLNGRDIDVQPPTALLTELARRSGTPIFQVLGSTIPALSGALCEPPLFLSWASKWLLRKRNGRSFTSRPCQQFCPHCLAEDEHPYLRRRWRLVFISTCIRHRVILRDCCPHCGADIKVTRAPSVVTCFQCRGDLRTGSVRPASDAAVLIQSQHEAMLDRESCEPTRCLQLRPHSYFSVLHDVYCVIRQDVGWESSWPISARLSVMRGIDTLDPAHRHEIGRRAFQVMKMLPCLRDIWPAG